jgi:plasmid stabilization system protein ParE
VERLLLRFELLSRHPHAGRLRPEIAPHIRSTAIKPTVVFYRVFPDESRLEIVRIIDGRRDLGTIFAEDA